MNEFYPEPTESLYCRTVDFETFRPRRQLKSVYAWMWTIGLMELLVEKGEIYWVYKGKKLNIKHDHEEIIQMWNDYYYRDAKKWKGPRVPNAD